MPMHGTPILMRPVDGRHNGRQAVQLRWLNLVLLLLQGGRGGRGGGGSGAPCDQKPKPLAFNL